MKKLMLLLALVFCIGGAGFAQRFCVIDSKYILDKLPEYEQAQKQIDNQSAIWQGIVDSAMQKVDQMYKSYQAERPILSETARKKREDEIVAKEKEAKDLQKKYFGYQGLVFQKRETLIKPIQDKVFNAVQQYARSRAYDIVYDKAGGITIFYADPKLDKSDDIVKLIRQTK
ncbi:MAG TPA: OmpH family outer membrane protein [Edaphocola sp.]|nr:OmpH family outer membrane protein [Edaphocola sp.]